MRFLLCDVTVEINSISGCKPSGGMMSKELINGLMLTGLQIGIAGFFLLCAIVLWIPTKNPDGTKSSSRGVAFLFFLLFAIIAFGPAVIGWYNALPDVLPR